MTSSALEWSLRHLDLTKPQRGIPKNLSKMENLVKSQFKFDEKDTIIFKLGDTIVDHPNQICEGAVIDVIITKNTKILAQYCRIYVEPADYIQTLVDNKTTIQVVNCCGEKLSQVIVADPQNLSNNIHQFRAQSLDVADYETLKNISLLRYAENWYYRPQVVLKMCGLKPECCSVQSVLNHVDELRRNSRDILKINIIFTKEMQNSGIVFVDLKANNWYKNLLNSTSNNGVSFHQSNREEMILALAKMVFGKEITPLSTDTLLMQNVPRALFEGDISGWFQSMS